MFDDDDWYEGPGIIGQGDVRDLGGAEPEQQPVAGVLWVPDLSSETGFSSHVVRKAPPTKPDRRRVGFGRDPGRR